MAHWGNVPLVEKQPKAGCFQVRDRLWAWSSLGNITGLGDAKELNPGFTELCLKPSLNHVDVHQQNESGPVREPSQEPVGAA